MSVFKTNASSTSSTDSNKKSAAPPTKLSNEKYVKVYERAEDVDQKRVTLPVNRDLYPSNTVTHTGQVFDDDDYRNIRFVNKAKLVCLLKKKKILFVFYLKYFFKVNPRFAIDFVRNDPVVVCKARGVWSDSGGPLGHPKVYINLVRYQKQLFLFCLSFKNNLGQTNCTQLWL
jgi:NADH dehydrogenase (ubiquinone) Fe-S protein 6